MKKILYTIFIIFLLTGCAVNNTPTAKAEELFTKYQKNDKEVLSDLDYAVDEEMTFTEEQRDRYREIVKKGYKDLVYEVKEETVDGNTAVVKVEIEVTDFTKIMYDADMYFQANPHEFTENGEYSSTKYNDYRLDKLEKAKDKVKYTLDIRFHKTDKKWVMEELSENDIDKINGTYKY